MRDNRVAATLIEQGRDVVLMPLYTPLRTDEVDVSRSPIYYGGINVFLEQYAGIFRRLPARWTRWLDAPGLLRWVMRFSGSTSASALGKLTVSILRAEKGLQSKELDQLIAALRDLRPDVVNVPDLMILGIGRAIREALGVPVLCTLSGEDIFLDELPEPYKGQSLALIREQASGVDGFVSATRYFADHAARSYGLPRDRVHVVPLGVRVEDFAAGPSAVSGSFTIGYLARICRAKGLMKLAEALVELRRRGREVRVRAGGYLAASDRGYLEGIRKYVRERGCEDSFAYVGEVDRGGKIELLRSSHVLSVPTVYHEAKGTYVIEAMAAGTPVVQPRHGSFPEFIEATGGGVLYDPEEAFGLVEAIERLMDDEGLRRSLSENARIGVRARFTDKLMAERTWSVFESCLGALRP